MFEDDWRRAEAYGAVPELSPEALAWEFLRRNPDYRVDYSQFIAETATGAEAGAEGRRFGRWGLTFRGRP